MFSVTRCLIKRTHLRIQFMYGWLIHTNTKNTNYEKNTKQQSRIDAYLNNAKQNKKRRKEPNTKNPVWIPKNANTNIDILIDECNNSAGILSIIKQNINDINHASIFGKAMKMCNNKYRDGKTVKEIMKLLLNSSVQPNVIEFSIFFNSMAHSDSPQISEQYFDIMVNKYGIIPEQIIFGSLIKGCRMQGEYALATKYWNLMKNKYEIEPDEVSYCEMLSVYAKCHDGLNATKVFNEYLSKVDSKQLSMTLPTFSAYLNVFSRNGDIENLESTINIAASFGLTLDIVCVADIMRGYISARKPEKAIEFLANSMETGIFAKPNKVVIFLKCVALSHIIKRERNDASLFEKRYSLYLEIENTIHCQLKDYRLNIDPLIGSTQLFAAIALYHNANPSKIVEIFEYLVSNKYIGYIQSNGIDLHSFQLLEVQFILRYVITFKLKQYLSKNKLLLIVGRGKHTQGSKIGNMKDFVINELLSYNPPIKCQCTDGALYIYKSELLPYLTNNNNCAMQSLTIPSNNWYMDDSRLKTM